MFFLNDFNTIIPLRILNDIRRHRLAPIWRCSDAFLFDNEFLKPRFSSACCSLRQRAKAKEKKAAVITQSW